MLELLLETIKSQTAKQWRAEVQRRRERTQHDPIADSMEKDAAELEAVLAQLRRDFRVLTPDQYAGLVKKSERTVRRWCAAGLIPGAEQDASGDWLIPATARPQRKSA